MLQEKLESKLDLHTLRSDNQDEGAIDIQSVRNGDKASQIRLSINYESPPVDLPTKLYILVTSGCLLQYAGEGPSDRLPEKILQLGKDSAAFAIRRNVLEIAASFCAPVNGCAVRVYNDCVERAGTTQQSARKLAPIDHVFSNVRHGYNNDRNISRFLSANVARNRRFCKFG
ncbi:hypothetical protein W97_02878 [Coniosporium apollinis CBS 100218]|uniref:Uncharacterized protein n=1 Tax=Coniosporium apollinis (strain CBS 100218) TaxID=1168221 RepID=R7YP06_CONA1|nr:uncharacterized protein W97_02878 [Coniosporium apollinis CBS 100218]EON63650.1 hypothetical protein W97_02878 [Coniosporium apollinis CBS 100218]